MSELRAIVGAAGAGVCAVVLAVGVGASPAPKQPAAHGYAITGITVVDVEKGTLLADRTVLVAGERIRQIGRPADVRVPKDVRRIDGRGLYLMPGLIDAHAHYYDPPVFGRVLVANGIVMVRDMGQPNETALPLRQALNGGTLLGPEMVATGWIFDGDPALIPQASRALKTPEEGRAAVREQSRAGVDQIKVYSRLEKDVFLAVVDEAKRVGLKPVGHVPESVYLEDAVAAGQRSIEHVHGFDKVVGRLLGEPITLKAGGIGENFEYWPRLSEVDPQKLREVLGRLRASGVVVCPTLIVFKSQAGLGDVSARTYAMSEYISPTIQGIWNALWTPAQRPFMERIWPPIATFVGELHRAGVPLMVGTDLTMPGVIPGYSLHEEMAAWQDAGIAAADVLRSATIVPARFMGRDDRLGSIAEGKVASFVLAKANPLEDIRNARRIDSVFLRGQYYSPADLGRLLKEARDLARQ